MKVWLQVPELNALLRGVEDAAESVPDTITTLIKRARVTPSEYLSPASRLWRQFSEPLSEPPPLAILAMLGEQSDNQVDDLSGSWLAVSLLELSADLSQVLLRVPASASLTESHRELLISALMPSLETHFSHIIRGPSNTLYCRSPAFFGADLPAPEDLTDRRFAEQLPSGAQARVLRQLHTELQMILHAHPVNAERKILGNPPINGVWLWGEGSLPDSPKPGGRAIAGADRMVKGLARWLGTRCFNDGEALLAGQTSVVGQWRPDRSLGALENLHQLEAAWVNPLARSLEKGTASSLTIQTDSHQIDVSRYSKYAFWRRAEIT